MVRLEKEMNDVINFVKKERLRRAEKKKQMKKAEKDQGNISSVNYRSFIFYITNFYYNRIYVVLY